mgnify:FL=1
MRMLQCEDRGRARRRTCRRTKGPDGKEGRRTIASSGRMAGLSYQAANTPARNLLSESFPCGGEHFTCKRKGEMSWTELRFILRGRKRSRRPGTLLHRGLPFIRRSLRRGAGHFSPIPPPGEGWEQMSCYPGGPGESRVQRKNERTCCRPERNAASDGDKRQDHFLCRSEI